MTIVIMSTGIASHIPREMGGNYISLVFWHHVTYSTTTGNQTTIKPCQLIWNL
jgi:hypothetical protein